MQINNTDCELWTKAQDSKESPQKPSGLMRVLLDFSRYVNQNVQLFPGCGVVVSLNKVVLLSFCAVKVLKLNDLRYFIRNTFIYS